MRGTKFKPKWSEPCLCGSGKKYKECCWQRLPRFDIGKDYARAVKDRNYEKALTAARADVVQYTIWHKSHTEPGLRFGAPIHELLKIDVDALADYVDRVLWLYVRLDRAREMPEVLERLRANIQHPTWRKKLAYFTALSFLGPGGDRQRARQEFAKAGRIPLDEADIDLLQLYFDLEVDDEPFSVRIKYIDQILRLGDSISNQLQYRGAKAVQYFMIGDLKATTTELTAAVDLAQASEAADPLSHYEQLLCARLLSLLSSLNGDGTLRKAAIGRLQELLLDENVSGAGRASILREIGDCYKYGGDWQNAEAAYRDALEADHNGLDQIHLAECMLGLGRVHDAAKQIDGIDRSTLKRRHQFEDFVFAYSEIAIWTSEEARLQEAKSLLQRLNTPEPYFNDRRLTLLVSVVDVLANGKTSEKVKASTSSVEKGISVASSIFILKPTFLGMGIDVNAIVDYLLKRKHKDKSE